MPPHQRKGTWKGDATLYYYPRLRTTLLSLLLAIYVTEENQRTYAASCYYHSGRCCETPRTEATPMPTIPASAQQSRLSQVMAISMLIASIATAQATRKIALILRPSPVY